MSKFFQPRTGGFTASGDLSAKKYHGVKLAAGEGEVEIAGAADADFVLMNDPKAGEIAECALEGGGCMVHSGAAFLKGALLTTDANGKFVTAASGETAIAKALKAATGADQYVQAERCLVVVA